MPSEAAHVHEYGSLAGFTLTPDVAAIWAELILSMAEEADDEEERPA